MNIEVSPSEAADLIAAQLEVLASALSSTATRLRSGDFKEAKGIVNRGHMDSTMRNLDALFEANP